MDKQQFSTPEQQAEAEKFFANIRQQVQQEPTRQKALTVEQERAMQDGFAVEEVTKMAGWQVIFDILNSVATHTWIDPRGMKKDEWEFAELNAFHAANNAKELLEGLNLIIQQAHELQGIKLGEVQGAQKMRV